MVKCKCFYCNIDDIENKDYYTYHMHSIDLNITNTRDLTSKVRDFYPDALINISLSHIKLDWGFHGWKRIVNNYINAVYSSWISKLQQHKADMLTEVALFGAVMRNRVDRGFKGLINGSIKLSILKFNNNF